MKVTLTLLHRIATSLMLLAVMALAVSGAVVPANAFVPGERLEYAGPEHSHMHGDGTLHSHVVAKVAQDDGGWPPFPSLDDTQDHEHQKADCGGLAHPVALPSVATTGLALGIQSDVLVPQEATLAFEVDPNGPRRPPRPLPNA